MTALFLDLLRHIDSPPPARRLTPFRKFKDPPIPLNPLLSPVTVTSSFFLPPTMVNTPRLYVDLIFRQSGCFANWDPTTVLRVGDYGTVRENDGELDVQGNIYDDGFGEKYGLQLPLPVTNTPSGEYVICSDGVRQTSLSSDIQLCVDSCTTRRVADARNFRAVPQIANCTLKGQWEAGDGESEYILFASGAVAHYANARLQTHSSSSRTPCAYPSSAPASKPLQNASTTT